MRILRTAVTGLMLSLLSLVVSAQAPKNGVAAELIPVQIGVGMGLILIAIAEMIGAKSGLGYMIWNAWEILSVETMYVGLIVIALLGFLFSLVLTELERWLVPWKAAF